MSTVQELIAERQWAKVGNLHKRNKIMNAVNCKCFICEREFRITKKFARFGNGYVFETPIQRKDNGEQIGKIEIIFTSDVDICPGCANSLVRHRALEVNYNKCGCICR